MALMPLRSALTAAKVGTSSFSVSPRVVTASAITEGEGLVDAEAEEYAVVNEDLLLRRVLRVERVHVPLNYFGCRYGGACYELSIDLVPHARTLKPLTLGLP